MSESAIERMRERGCVRSFRDLVAWQKSMLLAEMVYAATAVMPDAERFGLTSQLRRASVSVPSNIAEGFWRQARMDYLRHLRIARGSLAELQTQLEVALRLRMLGRDEKVSELAREVSVILQALIRSLERKEAGR